MEQMLNTDTENMFRLAGAAGALQAVLNTNIEEELVNEA